MKKIELKMKNEYQLSSSLIQIVGKSNFYLFINHSPLASHPVPLTSLMVMNSLCVLIFYIFYLNKLVTRANDKIFPNKIKFVLGGSKTKSSPIRWHTVA